MDKQLNVDQLRQAMTAKGLNQSGLAQAVGVSREGVRKWLGGDSFPRPDKLLRLAKTVGMSFQDLVIRQDQDTPVVAFRKARGTRTKEHHIENARTMGRMLRHLVPYLPFDVLAMPPVLKDPRPEYDYLRQAAALIRQEIHVEPLGSVDFHHLIRHFLKLQAVLIPVLWGKKQVHENATHIYLPDSRTTWIYLNLDVNVHDFKFWMAHELGHCLAPDLRGDEAEDFADAFAGMLLYPHELAQASHETISALADQTARLRLLMKTAEEHVISPLTIYKQANAYALAYGKTPLELEPAIYGWITRFNQRHLDLSATLFDGHLPPEPSRFVEQCAELFDTPIFNMLSQFIKKTGKGPGFVQTVLDIPLLDARGLHEALN